MRLVTGGTCLTPEFATEADGDAFYAMGNNTAFAIWVKFPSVVAQGRLISKQGSYYVALTVNDQLRFRFFGTPTLNIYVPYVPDVWTHWAFTYDGSNLKVFENGELVRTVSFRNMGDNVNPLYFFCRAGSTVEKLPGDTEVAWMQMLFGGYWTDEQVREIYIGRAYLTPGNTEGYINASFVGRLV